MYQMQDYIDAQFGGPGKGFYRIVTNPFAGPQGDQRRARWPWSWASRPACRSAARSKLDVPACNVADDRPPARRGAPARRAPDGAGQQVRQRALRRRRRQRRGRRRWSTAPTSSRPGRSGTCGTASRPTARATTTTRSRCPSISAEQQDALFGAIGQLSALPDAALPLYPPPDHCNSRGLTTLGEHTIKALAEAAHDLRPRPHEREGAATPRSTRSSGCGYPGVVSSHSWATPDAYPRIYKAGGFITPYAGDSTGFVEKWRTPRRLGRPALLLRASATAPT